MKYVYCVRDNKAAIYHMPFCQNNHVEAQRGFYHLVNSGESVMSEYPEDFDLMCLGTFNEETGKYQLNEQPEYVTTAVKAKKPSPGEPRGPDIRPARSPGVDKTKKCS